MGRPHSATPRGASGSSVKQSRNPKEDDQRDLEVRYWVPGDERSEIRQSAYMCRKVVGKSKSRRGKATCPGAELKGLRARREIFQRTENGVPVQARLINANLGKYRSAAAESHEDFQHGGRVRDEPG